MLKEDAKKILENAGYTCQDVTTYKNGIPFEGMAIHTPGLNVAPVIYNNHFETLTEESLLAAVEKYTNNAPAVNLGTWETDKTRVRLCLRKYIVDDVVTAPFAEDLQIYARIIVSEGENNASAVVHEPLLKQYGITAEELLQTAAENSKFESMNMGAILGADTPGFYVLSNHNRLHGAAAMTDTNLLASIAAEAAAPYLIIIPSSVHECIAIAAENLDGVAEIEKMIGLVNAENLLPEEILGTHPYIYTAATAAITAA